MSSLNSPAGPLTRMIGGLTQIPDISHALSFDVEDWYQGFIYRGISGWERYGSREKENLDRIFQILDDHDTKATFFVLGKFAELHPDIVKLIDSKGHEIGTHGHAHKKVPTLTPSAFRHDLERSIAVLEGITGKKITGHRAASWSITRDCMWALDILAEQGIEYDSSIFPTMLHEFGITDFSVCPCRLKLSSGATIYEFPAQVLSLGALRVPAAGGFYLRALPLYVSKWALRQSAKNGYGGMIYLHPYDLDKEVPRISIPLFFRFLRHYHLSRTEPYLRSLLSSFRFSSIGEILIQKASTMPFFSLSDVH